jgi:hypothetical protein
MQRTEKCLSNRYTNWDDFRHLINEKLTLKAPLKTEENIKAAVKIFNDTIQVAGWNTTPEHTDILTDLDCPIQIKQKIKFILSMKKTKFDFKPRVKQIMLGQYKPKFNLPISLLCEIQKPNISISLNSLESRLTIPPIHLQTILHERCSSKMLALL